MVERIRTHVGLAPAGGIADDLAQAVARWQRDNGTTDPALVVDGMAGPRTMPRLFPSGLAAPGQGAAFGAAAQANVFDRWDTLATARARGQALVDQINERLRDVGVPPVRLRLFNGSPNEQGAFDPFNGNWHMHLNRRLLDLAGLDEAGAQELADTVFHEARHTEQWFWMARFRAGLGRSVATIVSEMSGLPPRIARAARRSPIRPGTVEAVIASGWWESVFGSRAAHRDATLTRIERADFRLTREQCRFQRFSTPANQARVDAAQAEFDAAHERYQDLPEENDAFATGPAGATGVTGTPNPAPVPDLDPCAELTRLHRPLPGPAPSISDAGSSGDGDANESADVDQPEGNPPAITGPLHDTLPEDNLPE